MNIHIPHNDFKSKLKVFMENKDYASANNFLRYVAIKFGRREDWLIFDGNDKNLSVSISDTEIKINENVFIISYAH